MTQTDRAEALTDGELEQIMEAAIIQLQHRADAARDTVRSNIRGSGSPSWIAQHQAELDDALRLIRGARQVLREIDPGRGGLIGPERGWRDG